MKDKHDDSHRPGMNQPDKHLPDPSNRDAKNRGPGVKEGAHGNPSEDAKDQNNTKQEHAAERNNVEKPGEKPKGRGTY